MSQENYSPYCPICDACGEDGCCSAMCCQQHPGGDYCETYLKELKFGYALNKQFYREVYDKLTKELQEEWDKIWNEAYDNIFKSEEEIIKSEEEIKSAFIKKDNIDGEWLSPVPSERKWQEEKLVEIFDHYPNASPKWQYMNGLILIALEYIKLTKEDDNI